MGVTGLWRLVEPAGKPVPIETLENKVLAVDISIWLHQMVKGYQDAKGAPLPNAHLMGLFQRLCKLLYFRIKPVFVFDGGFPELKKETIAKRQDHKAKYNSESERIKRELALLLSKKTAVSTLLGKQISPSKQQPTSNNDDLFKLPALPQREESESESEDERNSSNSSVDLHTVDIESDNFKNLPIKEKYDILLDLKETRKQNSWGKLEELPKQSDNFSDFQMQRLLKRRKVQECLQETEKEMGDSGMSLNDLECLLNEEGIDTKIDTLPTRRIASNVTSRYLLIKDVKKAILDAKKRQEQDEYNAGPSTAMVKKTEEKPAKVDELEEDLQKAIKMSLECLDEPNTSTVSKTDDSWTSCMTETDSDYSSTDSEENDGFEQPDMSCAKAYIMQYSDFTHRAIDEFVTEKKASKHKYKVLKVDKIIEDINKEKSVIVDKVELSSSDNESNRNKTSTSKQIHEQIELNMLSNPSERNIDKLNETCEKNDNSLNTTQTSIVCIEDPVLGTITIDTADTSVEDMTTIEQQPKEIVIKKESILSDCDFHKATSSNEESSYSDNDFEEVPEIKSNENKAVVELTLKMDEIPDGNDIFADVFIHNKKENIKQIAPAPGDISCESTRNPKVDLNIIQTKLSDSNAEKTKNIPNTIISEVAKIKESADKTNIIGDLSNNSIHTTEINKQVNIKKIDAGKQENHNVSAHLSLEPINPSNVPKDFVSTEILNNMVEEIQDQEQDLIQEKGRLDRVGRNITEQMTKEAQELLQIFGIPYIVAPMEAEAQCAFLENAKLTDGTITDDSDIWLFGGRTVYKNFFNQKKHVLQFQAERIEKSFNLSREQLVLLALLVGSDYTTGVTGVGPVTAMEILASFPFNKRQLHNEATKQARYAQIIKGLQEFKLWVKAGKRTDNTSLKKKLKNVSLSEDFPSIRVVQAYLEPNVEKSEDKFAWGQLDVTILRDYTKAKFGWSQSKLDEIIMPVLKRLVERKSQKSMQDFFKRKIEFQSLEDQMSKRVKAAVKKMDLGEGSTASLQQETEKADQKAKTTTKRKVAKQSIKNKIVPSASKHIKNDEANVLLEQGVKIVSLANDNKSEFEIRIHKTNNYQETIPQREKERRNLLENKLKAIEVFRKTQIDKKRKTVKRKVLKPKEKAELSESDSD